MLGINDQFWHEKIKESGGPNISLADYTITARHQEPSRGTVTLTLAELQALGLLNTFSRQRNASWVPVPPMFQYHPAAASVLESFISKGMVERPLLGTAPNGKEAWHVSLTEFAKTAEYTAKY